MPAIAILGLAKAVKQLKEIRSRNASFFMLLNYSKMNS